MRVVLFLFYTGFFSSDEGGKMRVAGRDGFGETLAKGSRGPHGHTPHLGSGQRGVQEPLVRVVEALSVVDKDDDGALRSLRLVDGV
jgi:hypothetical protein